MLNMPLFQERSIFFLMKVKNTIVPNSAKIVIRSVFKLLFMIDVVVQKKEEEGKKKKILSM